MGHRRLIRSPSSIKIASGDPPDPYVVVSVGFRGWIGSAVAFINVRYFIGAGWLECGCLVMTQEPFCRSEALRGTGTMFCAKYKGLEGYPRLIRSSSPIKIALGNPPDPCVMA